MGARKPKLSFLTLSDFSSMGPTQDGRFKPDVVAPGHMIASANARNVFESDGSSTQCAPPPAASATNVNWGSRAVQFMSGTSMSPSHEYGFGLPCWFALCRSRQPAGHRALPSSTLRLSPTAAARASRTAPTTL
jgi:hypothetical protein